MPEKLYVHVDLGDGTTSGDSVVSHEYVSPGVYSVILTVSGASGADTETKRNLVNVRSPVAADFTARLPNADLEVVAEAGHSPWIDRLDYCAEQTTEFHLPQVPCHVAYTNPRVHGLIRDNLEEWASDGP